MLQNLGTGKDHVRARTLRSVNARIDRKTEQRIQRAQTLEPRKLERTMRKLDRSWDIDRAMMIYAVAGTALMAARALTRRRNSSLVPAAVPLAFLGLHALTGWSPATMLLRRFGFRTRGEIIEERVRILERS